MRRRLRLGIRMRMRITTWNPAYSSLTSAKSGPSMRWARAPASVPEETLWAGCTSSGKGPPPLLISAVVAPDATMAAGLSGASLLQWGSSDAAASRRHQLARQWTSKPCLAEDWRHLLRPRSACRALVGLATLLLSPACSSQPDGLLGVRPRISVEVLQVLGAWRLQTAAQQHEPAREEVPSP